MLGVAGRLMAGGGCLARGRPSRSCSCGATGVVGTGATDIVGRIAVVGGRFRNETMAQPASHPSTAVFTAYSGGRHLRSFQTDKKNRLQGFQSANPYVDYRMCCVVHVIAIKPVPHGRITKPCTGMRQLTAFTWKLNPPQPGDRGGSLHTRL